MLSVWRARLWSLFPQWREDSLQGSWVSQAWISSVLTEVTHLEQTNDCIKWIINWWQHQCLHWGFNWGDKPLVITAVRMLVLSYTCRYLKLKIIVFVAHLLTCDYQSSKLWGFLSSLWTFSKRLLPTRTCLLKICSAHESCQKSK